VIIISLPFIFLAGILLIMYGVIEFRSQAAQTRLVKRVRQQNYELQQRQNELSALKHPHLYGRQS